MQYYYRYESIKNSIFKPIYKIYYYIIKLFVQFCIRQITRFKTSKIYRALCFIKNIPTYLSKFKQRVNKFIRDPENHKRLVEAYKELESKPSFVILKRKLYHPFYHMNRILSKYKKKFNIRKAIRNFHEFCYKIPTFFKKFIDSCHAMLAKLLVIRLEDFIQILVRKGRKRPIDTSMGFYLINFYTFVCKQLYIIYPYVGEITPSNNSNLLNPDNTKIHHFNVKYCSRLLNLKVNNKHTVFFSPFTFKNLKNLYKLIDSHPLCLELSTFLFNQNSNNSSVFKNFLFLTFLVRFVFSNPTYFNNYILNHKLLNMSFQEPYELNHFSFYKAIGRSKTGDKYLSQLFKFVLFILSVTTYKKQLHYRSPLKLIKKISFGVFGYFFKNCPSTKFILRHKLDSNTLNELLDKLSYIRSTRWVKLYTTYVLNYLEKNVNFSSLKSYWGNTLTTQLYPSNIKQKFYLLEDISRNYPVKINKTFFNFINQFWPTRTRASNFYKFQDLLKNENFVIMFLRKTKIFNKSRYSRNRQLYRTGVYICLYINVIFVYFYIFAFYRLAFVFSFIWAGIGLFILAMSFGRALKYRFYNPVWFVSEFWAFFDWIGFLVKDLIYWLHRWVKEEIKVIKGKSHLTDYFFFYISFKEMIKSFKARAVRNEKELFELVQKKFYNRQFMIAYYSNLLPTDFYFFWGKIRLEELGNHHSFKKITKRKIYSEQASLRLANKYSKIWYFNSK